MKNRLGIQYVSSNTNIAPWNNNLTSGQNLGKMGTNSGSLIRKFNHCKGSGVPDVLECTLNPGCCPQKQEELSVFSVFGGIYTTNDGSNHAFVLDQVNGTWQSSFTDISFGNPNLQPSFINVCSSAPGYAVAGITCEFNNNTSKAFIINQKAGVWDSSATEILFQDPNASINSVSSSAPGYAVVGGSYRDIDGYDQAYVINQVNGTWDSSATKIVFDNAATNPNASIVSVSSSDPSYAVA